MMIDPSPYLRLVFAAGGREPPAVDCWGLYRLVVRDRTGLTLADYAGVTETAAIARTLRDPATAAGWVPVRAGDERPLDLVLMTGLAGRGRATALAPCHVGCVIAPGLMLDIEEGSGVMVRAFRATAVRAASPTVAPRVIGVWRAAAIAGSPAHPCGCLPGDRARDGAAHDP